MGELDYGDSSRHDAAVIMCQSHFIGAETQTVSHCRKILGEPTGLAELVLFYANVLPVLQRCRISEYSQPYGTGRAIVVTSHHGEVSLTCSNGAGLESVVAYS
jgi:hypothetical protein